MHILYQQARRHRYGLLLLVTIILTGISLATRIALLIHSAPSIDFSFGALFGVFFIGLFFDLVNTSYFVIPLVLYLWAVPQKIYAQKWHRYLLGSFVFLLAFILIFNSFSEWFFWDEFNTRFNFIAVDYLVYTQEVVGNIVESYPIGWYILGAVIVSAVVTWLSMSWIETNQSSALRFKERTIWAICLLLLPVVSFFFVDTSLHKFSDNAYVNELAGNGMYELFAAYRNNELEYERFYKTENTDEAFQSLRELLKTREAEFVGNSGYSYERRITADTVEQRLNVVMISVESLSADFLATYGGEPGTTPVLDSLAQYSLTFSNTYATGTRTVRGLEALSLCVPPTPGQSIVRRPDNENLFTLGKVFKDHGYESKYIYGGYGYFDNMNHFFDNNSYTVVDRTGLSDEEIDYENVWGVADENLYELAAREIDKTVANGNPAFAHIMTTSNHRPFTYPEGRIDIPSHTGRRGAVKYTDYAIGKFLNDVKGKPWFRNTIFVIVADHCHSSAGSTEVPIEKYHIPLLIYSPDHVVPGVESRLMSQIDLGPTLFGMLNFSYNSKFFGYDLAKLEPGRERAFISTYQSLGFVKGKSVVILHPQKKVSYFTIRNGTLVKSDSVDENLLHEAITWYQTSSYAFQHKLMRAN